MLKLFPLVVLFVSIVAQAEISGDYEYTDNLDGTCTITDYLGAGGDITIPETLNILTVTAIGNSTFYWNTDLTGVSIPGSVTTIGAEAFHGCSNLRSVVIPVGVT
ncbi:MAG: leucine-rich repeat protein, partial [Planctomycetota bacterium]